VGEEGLAMPGRSRLPVLLTIVCLAILTPTHAQWSSDPDANLLVAGGAGAQVQPKVRATPDNGCYISFYNSHPGGNPAYGYDVYLQRLDAAGVEQWAHGGIVIADRGFMGTHDYGLDVDADGNALLAFRDDRPNKIHVTAAKVDPSGTLAWGSEGIQVTSGREEYAAPKIAATSDGHVVVAWTQDDDIALQRLDADGNALWGRDGIVIPAIVSGSFLSVSDLKTSDAGTVIVSFVREFGSPSQRHLYANKIGTDGSLLWGDLHVAVFDGGTLQFGNFPSFVTDGAGGAAFGWYDVTYLPQDAGAQHVLSGGTEAYPHNGSAASTDPSRGQLEPSVCHNTATGYTFLFWREEAPALDGVYGQRYDAAGNRLWTESGIEISPVEEKNVSFVRSVQAGDGAMVYWFEGVISSQKKVMVAYLDGDGEQVCPPFPASTVPADKSRLSVDRTASGTSLLVWSDKRDEWDGDIYIQNVNANCTLGIGYPGEVSPPGCDRPLVFSDGDTLEWEDGCWNLAETFNLYRGGLEELSSGTSGFCHESGIPDSTTADGQTPSSEECYTYLVTAVNLHGEGTMGESSAGDPREPVAWCP
jgi:hypothetical protein